MAVVMCRAASKQAAAVQPSSCPQASVLFWSTTPTPQQVASFLAHPLLGPYPQTTGGFFSFLFLGLQCSEVTCLFAFADGLCWGHRGTFVESPLCLFSISSFLLQVCICKRCGRTINGGPSILTQCMGCCQHYFWWFIEQEAQEFKNLLMRFPWGECSSFHGSRGTLQQSSSGSSISGQAAFRFYPKLEPIFESLKKQVKINIKITRSSA